MDGGAAGRSIGRPRVLRTGPFYGRDSSGCHLDLIWERRGRVVREGRGVAVGSCGSGAAVRIIGQVRTRRRTTGRGTLDLTEPAKRLDPPAASAPTGAEAISLWTVVKESVRGEVHHDFTEGPIGRAILLLSIPMVLEVVLESVFAVADIFWVSHLGPDAVASVGLTESLLTLVYALAMGLGIGATATVARRIGEKDPEGAARAAVQALLLALIVSVVLGTAGALLAPRLLALMGASPVRHRHRPRLRHHHARRRGGDHRAVRRERRLPRRGRRGHRHARPLARQHHQHRARPAAHLRRGAVSPSSASPAPPSRRRPAARSARSTPWSRLFRHGEPGAGRAAPPARSTWA